MPQYRAVAAEDPTQDQTPIPLPSIFKPIIDKVGVPMIWFGIGYLAATMFGGKRA